MKKCGKCKKEKLLSAFYNQKDKKDGVSSHCKECVKKRHRIYYQTDVYKKTSKKYRKTKKYKKNLQKWRQSIRGRLSVRYRSILARCNNPKCKTYKYYGGRGIKCLFKTGKEFTNYILKTFPLPTYDGYEIHRIDHNKHYECGNITIIEKKIHRTLHQKNTGRGTLFQLKCYQLCSPDFAGLTQRQAAVVLKVKQSVVCVALRRLRKKCRGLFPIYRAHGKVLRYSEWMDFNVVREF